MAIEAIFIAMRKHTGWALAALTCCLTVNASPAKANLEFRIGLSQQGYSRLYPQFKSRHTEEKNRVDYYFGFFCEDHFASGTSSAKHSAARFTLRLMQRKDKVKMQFSQVTHVARFQPLDTPISFRDGNKEEVPLKGDVPILRLTQRFLAAVDSGSPELEQLATSIHQHFIKNDFPGKRVLLARPEFARCLLIPSGVSSKERLAFDHHRPDGIDLEMTLGITRERDEHGAERVRYEFEADPDADELLIPHASALAGDLVEFLSHGKGLAPFELSDETSLIGRYVQARLRDQGFRAPATGLALSH